MRHLLILAGAALVSTSGAVAAQDAIQPAQDQTTASPAQPAPMAGQTTPGATTTEGGNAATSPATEPPAMPDAQSQAMTSPGMAAPSPVGARHRYPLCSRTLHDECRNPGGK